MPQPTSSRAAGMPIVTLTFTVAVVAAFLVARHLGVANTPLGAMQVGGVDPGMVVRHEYWRALTMGFAHLSWVHLVSNLVGLLVLGTVVERRYGRAWVAALVLGGIALAGLLVPFLEEHHVTVGMSAGVASLAGFAIAIQPRSWIAALGASFAGAEIASAVSGRADELLGFAVAHSLHAVGFILGLCLAGGYHLWGRMPGWVGRREVGLACIGVVALIVSVLEWQRGPHTLDVQERAIARLSVGEISDAAAQARSDADDAAVRLIHMRDASFQVGAAADYALETGITPQTQLDLEKTVDSLADWSWPERLLRSEAPEPLMLLYQQISAAHSEHVAAGRALASARHEDELRRKLERFSSSRMTVTGAVYEIGTYALLDAHVDEDGQIISDWPQADAEALQQAVMHEPRGRSSLQTLVDLTHRQRVQLGQSVLDDGVRLTVTEVTRSYSGRVANAPHVRFDPPDPMTSYVVARVEFAAGDAPVPNMVCNTRTYVRDADGRHRDFSYREPKCLQGVYQPGETAAQWHAFRMEHGKTVHSVVLDFEDEYLHLMDWEVDDAVLVRLPAGV